MSEKNLNGMYISILRVSECTSHKVKTFALYFDKFKYIYVFLLYFQCGLYTCEKKKKII